MRKDISNSNQKRYTQIPKKHNDKTSVLPTNIDIGD